jgi:hypothetical protein
VAFTSDRGTEPDLHPRTTIWAVDVDAKAPRPREVLAPAGWASNPAWSPDGRWLAAIGILEADTLDDVSPGLLVGPSRGSAAPRAIAPDRLPTANWASRTNGWPSMVGPAPLAEPRQDRGDRDRPRPLAPMGSTPQTDRADVRMRIRSSTAT